MADSGFADTIRAKVSAVLDTAVEEECAEACAGILAALAGLEAEAARPCNRCDSEAVRARRYRAERDDLAAVLETTREALAGLMDAVGWLPATQEGARGARLTAAWSAACDALNDTRPQDAAIGLSAAVPPTTEEGLDDAS